MTITRANVEALLIKRCGPILTTAGLDGTTVAGTNADLGDPIAFALREAGITVATPAVPTDLEVARLATEDQAEFFDLAELRTLETVLQAVLQLVNTRAGSRADDYSQLASGLHLRIEHLELRIRRVYGYGAGTIDSDYTTLDFAQHGDDE